MLERLKTFDFLGLRLRTLPLARRKPRFVRYVGRLSLCASAAGLFLTLRGGATGEFWAGLPGVLLVLCLAAVMLCLAAVGVSMLAAVRYAKETRDLEKALADLDPNEKTQATSKNSTMIGEFVK
jgi:hypothetical protein